MEGEREEEKQMGGPLFPRLHIKDTEQRGPKPPPRNKMALYEQLSIPSQKFTSASASIWPFLPSNSVNLVSLPSSSHGGGQRRTLYSPICNSPAASHLAERLDCCSSDGMIVDTTPIKLEWKPMKPTKHHNLNAARQISMTAKCSFPHGIANSKNSSANELSDEFDCKENQTEENSTSPRCHNRAKWHPSMFTNGDKFVAEACSRVLVRLENVSECNEDQCAPLQMGDTDKNEDVSEKSIVDSMSGVEISPDDVVGVIGQKQFLKARRAIVHQQRVFAVQVFELHRLIKVQRLFAASPNLLLDRNLYLGESLIEVLPTKKLPSENIKVNDDLQKPNPNTKCEAENSLGKPPFPSLSSHSNKNLNTQQSNYKPYSPNLVSSTATVARQSSCFFHQPLGNQWLVPIMSPSEGLIYKPYRGPCPPTSTFMAPVYGITSSHQQGIVSGTPPLGQTYFPPYGLPMTNPSFSSSAVQWATQFTKSSSNGNENHLLGDIDFILPHQSSSSKSSGPNPLPLFPTDPTDKVVSNQDRTCISEQRTRVIKVVPHNPSSASESAARIFQSIQEERRQYA